MPTEMVRLVQFLSAKKARTAMETFMSEAIIIEGALASVLLALWMTWLLLRGLFWLMPSKGQAPQPIRFVANWQHGDRRRDAA